MKKNTVERFTSYYNKLCLNNQNAQDLIGMSKQEYKNALHITKLSNTSFQGQLRLLNQLALKENVIVKLYKKESLQRLRHQLGTREEEGFRIDFRERASLTKEDETYYSAHYIGQDGTERHIYAPTLKRLHEILTDLERIYNTKYRQQSIKILKYTAFIDREIQREIQQYLF